MTLAGSITDIIASRKTPRPPVLGEGGVHWLGRIGVMRGHRGRFDYAEIGGHEYRVSMDVHRGALDRSVTAAAVIETRDGGFRYGQEIPRGTYAELKLRQDAVEAKAAMRGRLRPCGVLESNPSLQASIGGRVAAIGYRAPLGRQAVRSVRAFIDHLESTGVERTIVGNDVVLIAPGGRVDVWYADALRSGIARLVIAIDRGKPIACEMQHHISTSPEAVDIALGTNVAICAAHLTGEIQ